MLAIFAYKSFLKRKLKKEYFSKEINEDASRQKDVINVIHLNGDGIWISKGKGTWSKEKA